MKTLAFLFCLIPATLIVAQEPEYDCIVFDNSLMTGRYYHSTAQYQSPSFILHTGNKLPVSEKEFFTPANSLFLNYVSAPNGHWTTEVIYPDWRGKDFLKGGTYLDLRLKITSNTRKEELPQLAIRVKNDPFVRLFTVDDLPEGAADTALVSAYLPLGKYIQQIEPGKWLLARIPLADFEGIHDTKNKKVTAVLMQQGAQDGKEHRLYIDQIELSSGDAPTAPLPTLSLQAKAYERHVDISWDKAGLKDVKYVKIYRAGKGEDDFYPVGIQLPEKGRYADYSGQGAFRYKIVCVNSNYVEGNPSAIVDAATHTMSDEELLTMVQEASFRYYWDGGESHSGLALENIPGRRKMIASGASGFGIMAIVAGTERGFISREESVGRFKKILAFLEKADRFHGAYPHYMDGPSAKVEPYFGRRDNGADLVETSFLFQGLLTARQYFDRNTADEQYIRQTITRLWENIEWKWFKKTPDSPYLYWHWSPDQAWIISHPLIGWNETMITYLLAIASPTHGVSPGMYYSGWASREEMAQDYRAGWGETRDGSMYSNGNTYKGVTLDAGVSNGGPLFFTHYSYMGFDPHGIRDKYVTKDYFENFRHIALINYRYCVENPKNNRGFGPDAWGMTASDGPWGYRAAEPVLHHDVGTIAPTGALASFPYLPEQAMAALKNYYRNYGHFLWGEYGFRDAFNLNENWCANIYMGLNQAPVTVMIENYRTGLIWKTFMKDPDIQRMVRETFIHPSSGGNP
ncbi:MAG: hypothetical protein LBB84_10155 [Tannerellaceae bacterium]|jgi:hypothetical protein|nr:hypothetical protein [Tannerellaceae bacterium]